MSYKIGFKKLIKYILYEALYQRVIFSAISTIGFGSILLVQPFCAIKMAEAWRS